MIRRFFKKIKSVFRKISKKKLLHNLYFLTIAFGLKIKTFIICHEVKSAL
jgi:hypothetical protein